MAINSDELERLIKESIPDAQIAIHMQQFCNKYRYLDINIHKYPYKIPILWGLGG